MMARMPELSSRLTSPTVKPSRLSISSCERTRSPEFLALPKSRLPSSTMAAHCRAMVPEISLAAAAFAASAGASESRDPSHCAAMASWSIWSLPAIAFTSVPSLNDDFLEQHCRDLLRRQRQIDAAGQLFLEAEQSARAVEVAGAQFAQVSLEDVGDARHRRLDRLDLLLFLHLEDDLDLEILHALAGQPCKVDHDLRHVDVDRWLGSGHFRVLFALALGHQHPAADAAAHDDEETDRGNDQLELAFFRRSALGGFRRRAAAFVIISHRPAPSLPGIGHGCRQPRH